MTRHAADGHDLRCLVLGPVTCWLGARTLPPGRIRHRKVLVRLALDLNRPVPMSSLVATVWDGTPPRSAVRVVRNAVSDLRTGWARNGLRSPEHILATVDAGYALRLGPAGCDLQVFADLADGAEQLAAGGDREGAVRQLRAALELWREPVFGGLESRLLATAAARWRDRHHSAWLRCLTLESTLGARTGATLIHELRQLVADDPYHEEAVAQLMLALYRSHRRVEALHTYHDLRVRLADDLGIDPDQRLRRLHIAILRGAVPSTALDSPGRSPGS